MVYARTALKSSYAKSRPTLLTNLSNYVIIKYG